MAAPSPIAHLRFAVSSTPVGETVIDLPATET